MTIDLETLATLRGSTRAMPHASNVAIDAAGELHPGFLMIRAEDWGWKLSLPFDRQPPGLDKSDPGEFFLSAWNWCRSAWTALLAPQLARLEKKTLRETEPFTFGYLSGAPAALIEFLEIDPESRLARSIVVGPYADVYGADGLFEAHQLCEAITMAGRHWPGLTRVNNFDTGWKVGYIEMIDLLSGDRPGGLLGRFLAEDPGQVADERRMSS